MSTIINKSNHPVEVKRIGIRVWKIRDEIEAAIAKKIADNDGNTEVDIEDIKKFYTRTKPKYLDPNYDPDDNEDNRETIAADGTDSDGSEMDEDALAMMDAIKSGEETAEGENAVEGENAAEGENATEAEDDESKDAKSENSEEEAIENKENANNKELTRIYPSDDIIATGFALLSDLNMEKILFFSPQGFTHGQNIALEFLIPNKFILSGEVVSSINMKRKSNIISDSKPNFRIEINITYLWEGERTLLRDFLKSVEPDIPPPPKKMKRPSSDEDEDDEFEDLGF